MLKPEEFKYIPIGDCIFYYGGTHLYHLRVPMATLTKAKEEFGNVQFNHYAMDEVEGLNLRQVVRDSWQAKEDIQMELFIIASILVLVFILLIKPLRKF